jgi:hypothetical protein
MARTPGFSLPSLAWHTSSRKTGSKKLSVGISGCVDKRAGYGTEHRISNVVFENVEVKGTLWTEESANLHCNEYTEAIIFRK